MTKPGLANRWNSLLSVVGGRRREKSKVPDVQHSRLNIDLPGPELTFTRKFELTATSLMHLPNELLLNIFKDVDDGALYSLSLLCRRLHYCTLPIYLARLGIPDALNLSTQGKVVLLISEMPDVLRGLRVALFVTSIKRIICKLQSYQQMGVYPQLRRLRRLLAKLTYVEEVTLDFQDVSWPYWYLVSTIEGWTGCLTNILHDIVIEKSCSTLAIRNGGHFTETRFGEHPSETVVRTIPSTPFNTFGNIVSSASRMLSSSLIRKTEIPRTSPLHSAWLASAPFLAWSTQTLNSSSITCLSLEKTSPTPREWSHVLPCLYMPTLVDLSLDSKYIPFADLTDFFARHSQINRLKLSEPYDLTASQPYLPITTLPKLKTLDAFTPYIIHLLTPGGSFPKLVSVTVSFEHSYEFNLTNMDKALIPVARRISQLSLSVRLDVTNCGQLRLKRSNNEVERSFRILHRLTSLKLCAHPSWLQGTVLTSQLVLFPMLTRISISNPFRGTNYSPLIVQFIATLRNTWITTVEYDDEIYRINNHLTL